MKKQLLVLIVGISAISFKCQNKPVPGPHIVKRDTTRTLAVHLNYGLRGVRWGIVNKIVADSFQLLPKKEDSTEFKKRWDKVTYYEVVVDAVVDSVLSKQFKVPLKDSLGNPNVINLKINAEKKYVVEPVYDLDSALKQLEQYVIKDSTQKK